MKNRTSDKQTHEEKLRRELGERAAPKRDRED